MEDPAAGTCNDDALVALDHYNKNRFAQVERDTESSCRPQDDSKEKLWLVYKKTWRGALYQCRRRQSCRGKKVDELPSPTEHAAKGASTLLSRVTTRVRIVQNEWKPNQTQ